MRILLLFMYIFSFPITHFMPSILTSTNLVGFVLIIYSIFDSDYRTLVIDLFKIKRIIRIILFMITIILFSIAIPIMHGTNDFSIITTLLNLMIKLLIGCLLFAYYKNKYNENTMKLSDLIIIDLVSIYLIQSFLMLVFVLLPDVSNIFNIFRSPSVINRSDLYGGARGLAIAGSGFFGLSVGYGFILFIYLVYKNIILKHLEIIFNSYISYFICFAVLVFGAVMSARSSLLGILIALIYIFVEKFILSKRIPSLRERYQSTSTKHLKLSIIIIVTALVLLLGFGFYLIYTYEYATEVPNFLQTPFSLFRYLLDPFYEYFHNGVFEISSLNALFDMYFPVDAHTFFFGDGYYTNPDGTYYMHTDAGYMRNILFFGFFGLILLFGFQVQFLGWKNRDLLIQNGTIMMYILILHYKGEVLGFSQLLLTMMILIVLAYDFDEEKSELPKQCAIIAT